MGLVIKTSKKPKTDKKLANKKVRDNSNVFTGWKTLTKEEVEANRSSAYAYLV